jgi:hypothetical protein
MKKESWYIVFALGILAVLGYIFFNTSAAPVTTVETTTTTTGSSDLNSSIPQTITSFDPAALLTAAAPLFGGSSADPNDDNS